MPFDIIWSRKWKTRVRFFVIHGMSTSRLPKWRLGKNELKIFSRATQKWFLWQKRNRKHFAAPNPALYDPYHSHMTTSACATTATSPEERKPKTRSNWMQLAKLEESPGWYTWGVPQLETSSISESSFFDEAMDVIATNASSMYPWNFVHFFSLVAWIHHWTS